MKIKSILMTFSLAMSTLCFVGSAFANITPEPVGPLNPNAQAAKELMDHVSVSPDAYGKSAVVFFRNSMLQFGYTELPGQVKNVIQTVVAYDPAFKIFIPGIGTTDPNLRSATVEELFAKGVDGGTKYIYITTNLAFNYDFQKRRMNITVVNFTVREIVATPVGSGSSAG